MILLRQAFSAYPECLALLENLSPHERMLVRQVLASIVEGQAWDLMYFESHAAVSCPEQIGRAHV